MRSCCGMIVVAAVYACQSFGAHVAVDLGSVAGPVKPVNGVGQPPMAGALAGWPMMHYLKEAGIPYSRLHDVGGWLGGGLYVDIPNIFPDFDADESDPKSYRFAYTDSLLKALDDNGVEPYFRLGVSIENFVQRGYPPVNILPPKDFAKWGRICEHVIRHYTEGWADGFKMKISHWEIWNEPENNPDEGINPMFRGPFSEYMRLYGTVAPYLKSRFPHLRIGGYGSCGFYAAVGADRVAAANSSPRMTHFVDCFTNFLEHARTERWPLDFFSFHSYSAPDEARRQIAYARQTLDAYGFKGTAMSFNEWLPSPSPGAVGTPRQAAMVAAELVDLQNGPCDTAMIYDAGCRGDAYSPLFHPLTKKPLKAYYAFMAFNELRKAGTAVAAESDDGNVRVAAAKGASGLAVMVVNCSEKPVRLSLSLGEGVALPASCRMTDGERTWEDVPMPDVLPAWSFAVAVSELGSRSRPDTKGTSMKTAAKLTWPEVAAAGMAAAERTAWDSGVVRGEAVAPVSVVTNAAGHLVYDFGRHMFGWVEVEAERPGAYEMVWGELLDGAGSVQTNELYTSRNANVRFAHAKGEFSKTGWARIPYAPDGVGAYNRHDVGRFGKVMPFRWLEVVAAPFEVLAKNVRQVPVHYPYDMSESAFSCDSAALERVYGFCKHTIRATSFMGVFVDGDRERIPYEGDAFITMLGSQAISSDYAPVRRTIGNLAEHPMWPTEWKQFFIRMVYEDWMHSGKDDLVRRHWALMRDVKSWRSLRREDGLVVSPGKTFVDSPDGWKFSDIVDWANDYRDGFVFTPLNVVVNALHYRNLRELEAMARAIGEDGDAAKLAAEAAQTFDSFQRVFFDESAGRFRDGVGTDHATVQGNAMALSCGVVSKGRMARVADYVATRGFSCSTYMSQFVLDALFAAGREDDALKLMTADGERSWLGMMEKGATITMEFWDLTLAGSHPDMSHAWSTAPLNMISRWVLGVNPLKPGFDEVSVSPRPGFLRRLSGAVPTPRGSIGVNLRFDGKGGVVGEVVLPQGVSGTFSWRGSSRRLGPGRNGIGL